jgi:hypothetical protein
MARFFYIERMDKIIHISVKGGIATVDKCPQGCVVLIKDYDSANEPSDTLHKKYKDASGEYTLEVYDHVNFEIKSNEKSS